MAAGVANLVTGVYHDVTKAPVRAHPSRLLQRLMSFVLSGTPLPRFRPCLFNRHQAASVEAEFSYLCPVTSGIIEGRALAPQLQTAKLWRRVD